MYHPGVQIRYLTFFKQFFDNNAFIYCLLVCFLTVMGQLCLRLLFSHSIYLLSLPARPISIDMRTPLLPRTLHRQVLACVSFMALGLRPKDQAASLQELQAKIDKKKRRRT